MSVSVVIPNLHSPMIDRTVASLEVQQPNDFEIIVVGQDRYGLVYENERVRFLRTARPATPAIARNLGTAVARGEIIAFVDADCCAAHNWLSVLLNRLADPNVHVIGGGVDFDRHGGYWTLADNISMFYRHMISAPGSERTHLPTLNLALRRSALEQVGGFDERYPRPSGEDSDLSIRLRQAGYVLHFEPRAVVTHHPPRPRMWDMLRHGFLQGKYSTKVDPRYAALEGTPRLMRRRLGVLLFAPLAAAGVAARIFVPRRDLWPYWYTAPAIYMSKIAWCLGALCRPRGGIRWGLTPAESDD